jgi:hypothetical protein
VEAEAGRYPIPIIRIAITAEAYEAIAPTLMLGTVACEPQPNENGEHVIWIGGTLARQAQFHPAHWRDLLRGHHQAGLAVGRTWTTVVGGESDMQR